MFFYQETEQVDKINSPTKTTKFQGILLHTRPNLSFKRFFGIQGQILEAKVHQQIFICKNQRLSVIFACKVAQEVHYFKIPCKAARLVQYFL